MNLSPQDQQPVLVFASSDGAQVVEDLYVRWAKHTLPLASDPSSNPQTRAYTATLIANLAALGYAPSPSVINNWLSASSSDLALKGLALVQALRTMLGVHVHYQPMYPNFPQQVMEASEAELLLNAMVYYAADAVGLRVLPVYTRYARRSLDGKFPVSSIDLGSVSDFTDRAHALMSSSASLSSSSQVDLRNLARVAPEVFTDAVRSASVSNKENLAYLYALSLTEDVGGPRASLFTTATDVLRVAAALSGSDVSLSTSPRFASFSKHERRVLLSMINDVADPLEDMMARREQFKRLGERLHPGQYSRRFPRANEAFAAVRNKNFVFESFASRVERDLSNGDILGAAALLQTRPGYLARRLNELLSKVQTPFSKCLSLEDAQMQIAHLFAEVADQVSTTVLLQVQAYFTTRSAVGTKDRLFLPKGSVAHAFTIADQRKVLVSETAVQRIIEACDKALETRFCQLEPLGKVYVDESLKNFKVPFGVRSASKTLRTVGRGTCFDLPEDAQVLRFFIWWQEGVSRADIDLSAVGLDEDFVHASDITYYNLLSGLGVHSGDITSAPQGASEFIDIDLSEALRNGMRYVVMTVHSYTGQHFADLPQCFAGFMTRKDAGSGEIYDPRTVQEKMDLRGKASVSLPLVFDLSERKAYWLDMSLSGHPTFARNVENTSKGITAVTKAMVNSDAANLYDLFTQHGFARGQVVDKREDADVVFAVDGDVTPFDTVDILDRWVQ